MPSSNQAVERPVPEPNSRKRPPGLVAASVRKNAHVNGSDAMVKPMARVACQIAGMAAGSLMFCSSFMGFICLEFEKRPPPTHQASEARGLKTQGAAEPVLPGRQRRPLGG